MVTFYQLIAHPGAPHMGAPRLPERAVPDACGTLPARALRYCEPVRAASAYGYYLFPPMDLGLHFDGADIAWSFDETGSGVGENWWPLDASVHYPGFVDHFNATAPAYLRDLVPPLMTPGDTRGTVQIWTGAIAHTREDWSLLIRGPVNDSRRALGFEVLEGIVETDRWGGHLFANIQMLRTDISILLPAHRPLVQAVPVHRANYADRLLDAFKVQCDIPDDVWQRYGEIVIGKRDGSRAVGQYAVDSRRRRRDE